MNTLPAKQEVFKDPFNETLSPSPVRGLIRVSSGESQTSGVEDAHLEHLILQAPRNYVTCPRPHRVVYMQTVFQSLCFLSTFDFM